MDGRPRHRGAAFRLLALSLSLFAAGCARPGDPAALRAAFLGGGDIMAHVPKLKGLGIDTPQPLAHGAPESIRTTVRFASNDGDLYGGTPTIIEAALLRPAGPGPFPGIVALHDCLGLYGPSGAMTSHMRDWAERLVAQGYAVIFPDSFNPRGVPEMCSRDPDLIRPGAERSRDAAAALGWLQAQPWIVPDRVGLIGWANGGTTALTFATTDGRLKQHYGQPDFRLIVAFYPNCEALTRAPGWRSDLPLTVFAGGQDDWAPARACVDLAAQIEASGGGLDLVKYFMAHHDFDAPGMPVHLKAGVTTTVSGGAVIGTDPMARADAVQRVTNLLASTLRP